MSEIYGISDISIKFNVTSRTLRYYEEIGLLNSIRKGDSKYRHYDKTAVARLDQILMLRKLTFSIKEIQDIFSSKELSTVIAIFTLKLDELKAQLKENEVVINLIEKMLQVIKLASNKHEGNISLIQNAFYSGGCNFIDSEKSISDENIKDISRNEEVLDMTISIKNLNNIRILKLRPMKVAYFIAESQHPEDDAWAVMKKWVKENNLQELFSTRHFGFNNPNPSPESPVYGYEVWTTVTDNVEGNEEIGIKDFEGGLYAVAATSLYDIVQSWQQLSEWVQQNETYKMGSHRWLEEHLILNENSWGPDMQIDLYCPIELR